MSVCFHATVWKDTRRFFIGCFQTSPMFGKYVILSERSEFCPHTVCKKWTCIGLRRIILEVCDGSCSRCRSNEWFAKTVNEFIPPTEAIAKPLCANLGVKFCELPPVCDIRNKFGQPAMLEAVDPDKNCVCRLLTRAIG